MSLEYFLRFVGKLFYAVLGGGLLIVSLPALVVLSVVSFGVLAFFSWFSFVFVHAAASVFF